MPHLISIIVPTRNNSRDLCRLLESIDTQRTEMIDVHVVDGSSLDTTPIVAGHYQVAFHVYPCDKDMRGFARNLGARLSDGEYLMFIDSDMELSAGVLLELQGMIARRPDGIVIPERNIARGIIDRLRTWERGVIAGQLELCAARLVRRDLFVRAGGFDERILGFEDLDLQATLLELGARLERSRTPIMHHEESLSLVGYLRKRRYYRQSARLFRIKHPHLAKRIFSPLERLRLYVKGIRGINDLAPFLLAIALRTLESV